MIPPIHIPSPVPFWFLNGPVEEWHVVREFDMMHEKGIEEVVVHPRYGLDVDYLSDGWFTIFGWCVREAKKLGMRVWIYDEFNWPSGTAGMTVMKHDPNYQSKFLAVDALPLDQIDLSAFQPGAYVIAANVEGGTVTKTRLIENVNSLVSLTGAWRIFNCTLKHDPYYIDTLSRDAVNCFKKLTYDAYYERFGDEFGKTITAIFTDEPSIYWVSVGYDDWNLPYTDDYFQTFHERYGYDCAPLIPYLFLPGREGSKFRADYWEHAGRLFNERYHSNLGAWCREHGIIYTGHNHHEEPLRYQIRFQGDMFGAMREMDIPGVDHLGKPTLGNPWISIIGHKICSSSTHASGKPRCMSESFGIMDWDTTYTNLKRVADWQYALGINLLVPHAVYHTISGMTKRECPPSIFHQSPHWHDFDYFARYVRRMEEMLTGGRHICKVAVMYPLTGLWASYQTDLKTTDFQHIDNFLSSLCLELVRNQIDFDLIDFPTLAGAPIEDARIKVADEEYEFLLVPSTPYLRPAEVKRLTQIVSAGVNTTFFHKAMEPIQHNLPTGLAGATFVQSSEIEAFAEILRRQVDHDIQIMGGGASDIMIYRRELPAVPPLQGGIQGGSGDARVSPPLEGGARGGRKITFLLNRSEKHRKVSAILKDYPDAAIYDHETGVYTRLDEKPTGRKTLTQLRFQPNQSYFIVSNVDDAAPANDSEAEPVPIALGKLAVEVPFNVASLYHFRYTRADAEPDDIDVRTNPRYMPVNWSPDCPDWTEWAGTYEADVEINAPTDGIRLILDRDFSDCEVYVNDTPVDLTPCCTARLSTFNFQPPFLTDFFDVHADISHLLKPGMNHFRVTSPTKLSEPLRLVGQFHVDVRGTQIVLNEAADPSPYSPELDYPFYSGTVVYRTDFELDRDWGSLILNLHDVRDSAAVRVNGQFAGARLWEPYVLDITPFAKVGGNTIEIEVRNNMTNLISGNPRPFGLRKMPTLDAQPDDRK